MPFQTVLCGLLGCASEGSDVWFNFDEDAKGELKPRLRADDQRLLRLIPTLSTGRILP